MKPQNFLLLLFLFVGTTSICAQESNYVLVKIYEPITKNGDIIIAYGNGKSETISVEKLDSDHHEHNSNKLVDVFNRLDKEGYELKTSSASAHGNPASILHTETFVFGRKD